MASFRWAVYDRGIKPFRMYDQGYALPRANHADMFLWHDGSKFDWNNPEHKAHPFLMRQEIRLATSVCMKHWW